MSIDTDTERLRALVAELDQLLTGPSQQAAVDPDGFPSHVASGELIESAWGNAVVNQLHTNFTGRIVHSSSVQLPDLALTTITAADLSVIANTSFSVPTRSVATLTAAAGFAGAATKFHHDIFALSTSTGVGHQNGPVQAAAGCWAANCVVAAWSNAANINVGAKARIITDDVGGGTVHTGGTFAIVVYTT